MSWIEDPGEDFFQELNLSHLMIDEAYLNVTTTRNACLYILSDDCYNCPYIKTQPLVNNEPLIIDVTHGQSWKILSDCYLPVVTDNDVSKFICNIERPEMGEFGVYNLNIDDKNCTFTETKEPVNIYLPIIVVLLILLGIIALCRFYKIMKSKFFTEKSDIATEKAPERKRVKSLDTFRGMSIILMIFVNDGAGHYWWLEHATWNGLTVGDLVFPCFLWIMGVCIPMSVKSIVKRKVPKMDALINIFRRSCILFMIGLSLGTIFGPTFEKIRIFGVLQRFGVSYWVVASISVILAKRQETDVIESKFRVMFKDIIELGPQWLIMISITIIHLIVTFCASAPGCPTGYLGPGGMQDNYAYKNCVGGITKYVDLVVMGDSHIFQFPTAKLVYLSGSFDPEGIFGCLLSIVHVFFGVQAGNTLLHHKKWKPLLIRWGAWALATGVLGAALCGGSKEDGVIPINKNLWSLSFVLVTSCFAFIILSICYVLVDVTGWWNGSPFIEPGMNSIIMYVGHSICYSIFPFHWSVKEMRTHFIFLVESIWGTVLWIVIACVLKKKKIFYTI